MNRRNFVVGTSAALALSPLMGRIAAQDAPTLEARWDDASQMYGNAWDYLPKVEDGNINLLSVSFVPYDFMDVVDVYGVIHNNTDDPMALMNLTDDAGTEYDLNTPVGVIPPRAYVVLNATDLENEGAYEDGVPTLLPEFIAVADIPAALGITEEDLEEILTENITYPMRIDSLTALEDPAHLLTVTNTNDVDIDGEEFSLRYNILFFDEAGLAKDGNIHGTIEMTEPLLAGATMELEPWYLFHRPTYALAPDTPYLISCWAE